MLTDAKALFDRGPTLDLARSVDLLPPEGLRVTATAERQISLAWDPVLVGDVDGYAVLRAADAAGPYTPIGRTSSRFATVFSDEGMLPERLGDGTTWHYRVHPVDSRGAVSKSHTYAPATTDPRPETPSGLHAYSNLPRKVVLGWDPNRERAVDGYTVLRSPMVSGPWERRGDVRGRLSTVYEDAVPGDLRVMYYRLLAANSFGGESDPTEPIRAVTKAEPLPPIDLAAAAEQLGAVELTWSPNVERDLVAYRVFRSQQVGDAWRRERLLAVVPSPETGFRDDGVACGQVVRYRLQALDGDGLLSEHSGSLEVTARALNLAVQPVPDQGLELRWDRTPAVGWHEAAVYELRRALPDRLLGRTGARGPFRLDQLGSGARRVAVTLTSNTKLGTRQPEERAPRCELDIAVP